VLVDPAGGIVFKVVDPSLGQRMLYLATVLPSALLVAWIARRMRAEPDSVI
jgi:cation transporter-like permease